MRKRRIKLGNLFVLLGGCLLIALVSYFTVKRLFFIDEVEITPEIVEVDKESKIIVVDAGHGGYDDGAIAYDGSKEKEIALAVSKYLELYLDYEQYDVIMTRDSDEVDWSSDNVEDLAARSKIANESGGLLFVSLHCNDSDIADASGDEIYVYFEQEESYKLAEKVNNQLKNLPLQNREMKDAGEYPLQVLADNKIPSIIIEMGFLSNQADTDYLNSEEGQKEMAYYITQGNKDYVASLDEVQTAQ